MDERIARIKTAQEARTFAVNARRKEHPELEAQALERAAELRAQEEGFRTPAEQAIGRALHAYEEQQSQLKGRAFRANRTRQMLAKHGAIAAAERMVLYKRPSKGYEVLEDAGLQELSFEAIIERFPDEFSPAALAAARARLEGKPPPAWTGLEAAPIGDPSSEVVDEGQPSAIFDGEALAFLQGFRDPKNWFMAEWLPLYREATQEIAQTLADSRPEDVFYRIWKTSDNDVSSAGQGLLSFELVDEMHDDLIDVIRLIYEDGSPASFERIVDKFEGWKADGRIGMVPRLLIARAFAAIHPVHYHTTVDALRQKEAMAWFVTRTNFTAPKSTSWAVQALAMVEHLDRAGVFGDDIHARNLFPWFVVDQIQTRGVVTSKSPPLAPRPFFTFVDLLAARRVMSLRHRAVQIALMELLAEEHGKENVWAEHPTGTGGYADALARRPDGKYLLYEIKIAPTAAEVVRQAMGQLLEYGFRAGGLEPAKIVVVGEPALDEVTRHYLDRLRADFSMDIDYVQVRASDESVFSPLGEVRLDSLDEEKPPLL